MTFVVACDDSMEMEMTDTNASEAAATDPGAWSAEEIRRVGYRVVDMIAEYLTELPGKPVFQPVPPEVIGEILGAAVPGAGAAADAVLDEWAERVAPYPFGNGHPRFYGWVNSPPTPIGIFADALAAAMNPSVAGGNHAAVYVERAVIDWFRQVVGFPEGAMGLLVSGGSMAALTGLAVARHARAGYDVRARGLQGAPRAMTVYKGAEGHGTYQKSVELMGIGSDHLRIVPSDEAGRIDPRALEAAIAEDVEKGHLPLAVVASAGTVNTGAIDPLDAIADVCERHGAWLHVDGAYGGPALLSDRYRPLFRGIERADSIALDPHKWLYVPIEAGVVLVRRGEEMRQAFSLVPPYLRTDGSPAGVGGPPWLSEYGFQQTRGFRALKVWMALKHHGTDGYRRAIERDVALASHLAALVRADPEMELWEPQGLSIACFRLVPRGFGGDAAALDDLNRRVLEAVQLSGDAFLSSTVLGGRFFLRACIVNPLAREADVEALLDAVRREAARAGG
jgi:glutamate/tyrosine decarboxylase-like PLP-dependent enzyme